jgi:pimeloyl-ACP methyl ester carboxylesterase
VLVFGHGLLMNRRMYARFAPEIASRGNRVITIDFLGHGRSDRPVDPRRYSMSAFGDQIAALLDHLEIDRAVVGGTSLGANSAIEFGVRHPDRAQALVIEMPVLDNASIAVAAAFTPIMLALRFGMPVARAISQLTRRIPRTHYLVDILLDWVRQDPEPSLAVLKGLLQTRTSPPASERMQIKAPTLVIGHPNDPLHPFSDAGMLVSELEDARLIDANSMVEWRFSPSRLNDELAAFLDEVWTETPVAEPSRSA